MTEEEKEGEKDKGKGELSSWAMAGTMAVAFGFGICLFFLLPLYLTKLMTPLIGSNNIIFNLVDGVIRVMVFSALHLEHLPYERYSTGFPVPRRRTQIDFRFRVGRRTERGECSPIQPSASPLRHQFSSDCHAGEHCRVLADPKLWPFYVKAGARVVLLPRLIAGISYEFLKWSAKDDGHPLVKMIIAPGLALQRLTTREPDDQQLEVAIRSMNEALEVNAGYAVPPGGIKLPATARAVVWLRHHGDTGSKSN